MLLKTILNECCDFRYFIISKIIFNKSKTHIEVQLRARSNRKAVCSGCELQSAGYDRLPAKKVLFNSLLGFQVFFVYAMRRVNCKACGIKVEKVPWVDGKRSYSKLI